MSAYVTMIPRKFTLESDNTVTLTAADVEERLVKDTVFRLWVPDIERVYRHLVEKHGFETATPKGERYSLRKILSDIWELHVRLYDDGLIDAEVEARGEPIGHLPKLNVVYEAFNFYRDAYDKLHILYSPQRQWITKVIDHFYVKLRKPDMPIPWKPIVLGIAVTGLGLSAYTLSRPAGQ